MRDRHQTAMTSVTSALTLIQLPITMAVISYWPDPAFALYTTSMRNTTTHEMDVDVEAFNASALYFLASVLVAGFGMASKTADLETSYTVEIMEELALWDLAFWSALTVQHVCLVAFMCSPLDWYFLALMVAGISLLLMLLTRLPLYPGRSRENLLLLMGGMLFLMLHSAVRRKKHGIFFMGLLFMDGLVLVGHTYDAQPDLQIVGNCRLTYVTGMSGLLLMSYISGGVAAA